MDQGSVLTEGGIIAGLVTFRLPDGLALPIAVHHPDRPTYYPSCWRCADSGHVSRTQRCPSCRPLEQDPTPEL